VQRLLARNQERRLRRVLAHQPDHRPGASAQKGRGQEASRKKVQGIAMEQMYTRDQVEEQKRAMYEGLSPRRRRFVDRIGYDNWDPYQAPFDPIDIRTDAMGYTTHDLLNKYFKSLPAMPDPDYMQTLSEFMVMLVMNVEKVRPILEFSDWYNALLKERGISLK